MQMERLSFFVNEHGQRAASAVRAANSQPIFVRLVALLLIVVLAIPIAALIMATLLIAAIVVSVYLIGRRVRGWFRNLLPRDDGRENVRVIRHTEQRQV